MGEITLMGEVYGGREGGHSTAAPMSAEDAHQLVVGGGGAQPEDPFQQYPHQQSAQFPQVMNMQFQRLPYRAAGSIGVKPLEIPPVAV